nr:MAG TPA: hypothetical protein [Caudoviricetes sp.]
MPRGKSRVFCKFLRIFFAQSIHHSALKRTRSGAVFQVK